MDFCQLCCNKAEKQHQNNLVDRKLTSRKQIQNTKLQHSTAN